MALRRYLRGECDRQGCTTTQEMSPDAGAPYHFLKAQDWQVVTAPAGPSGPVVTGLLCPEHRTDKS